MPGFNQTGPMGQGPMTGRKMGRCTNFGAKQKEQNVPSPEIQGDVQPDQFPGRSWGRGFRIGRRGGKGRGMGQQDRFGR